MKDFISWLFIILGILAGLWFGGYIMLYGGIMQIGTHLDPFSIKDVFFGAMRILFCELGWALFIFIASIGVGITQHK